MSEVLLFHHAHGQTSGFVGFADELRAAGHTVHTPDLFEGQVFDDLNEGVDFAQRVGMPQIVERGAAAAASLPDVIVYAGFSLGSLPAQWLAQNRPGAVGSLLFHGGIPAAMLDSPWPAQVPLQIHVKEIDPWVELEEPQALARDAATCELFIYPGSGHLFADPGSPDFEPANAALLMERTMAFLALHG